MTRASALFALAAILPASLGAAVPARTHSVATVLCSGRTVELPVPSREPVPDAPCCAKACHTGSTRKRDCH